MRQSVLHTGTIHDFCLSLSDGLDFNSTIAVSDTIIFPLSSIPGDTHCIIIGLINDIIFEANEDFVVELSTSNPSVIISEDANLAVVTIRDTPHPLCKILA